MSRKSNRNNIHKNVLLPSIVDEIELSKAVEDKFLTICGDHKNIRGIDLIPPRSLDKDMLRWRQMASRHGKGDFRHSEAEYKSLKVIAQWTLDINCSLRGQPLKKMKWKE